MHLGDVGHAIQTHAERHGFSVVREFCGHGIGRKFHEEPQVLHYGRPGTGVQPGAGDDLHHRADDQRGQAGDQARQDGWTVVTKDHSLSAQWEHTVLVTADGYEVLTLSAGTPAASAARAVSAVTEADVALAVAAAAGAGAHRALEAEAGRRARRPARALPEPRVGRGPAAPAGAARRPPAEGSLGEPRDAARRRAGRGRRLRARGAVPLLRRRPADPARGAGGRRARPQARGPDRHAVGHRPRGRPQRAHHRRMRRRSRPPTSRCRRRCSRRGC